MISYRILLFAIRHTWWNEVVCCMSLFTVSRTRYVICRDKVVECVRVCVYFSLSACTPLATGVLIGRNCCQPVRRAPRNLSQTRRKENTVAHAQWRWWCMTTARRHWQQRAAAAAAAAAAVTVVGQLGTKMWDTPEWSDSWHDKDLTIVGYSIIQIHLRHTYPALFHHRCDSKNCKYMNINSSAAIFYTGFFLIS